MLFEIILDCLLGVIILNFGNIGVEIYAANAEISLTLEEIMDLRASVSSFAILVTAIIAEVFSKSVFIKFGLKKRDTEEDEGDEEEE